MGKLLTRLPDSRLHNCERFGQQQRVRAAETLKSSHRPDGKNADALALILALHNWECFGQLQMVRATETFKSSHRPGGKMADMPKSTLIFQFGSLFGSIRQLYVPATPANFPSPRWEDG